MSDLIPGTNMTYKERADAYSRMATTYSDKLDAAKDELEEAALPEWLYWMDSE